MATTRNAPAADPDESPQGFTEEQRGELEEMIARVVAGAKPPEAKPAPAGPPAKSDDEWDAMSDRQRESWVRSLVDFRLDELSRDDEMARQRSEIDALKNDKTPEPEKVPSVVSKIQKFLWGDPDQKS
jgi:hypothetical protein